MFRFEQNEIAPVLETFISFLEKTRERGCKELCKVVATRVTHKISAWGTWIRHDCAPFSGNSSNYIGDSERTRQKTNGVMARLGLYGIVIPDGNAEWVWRECHPVHADPLWELETRNLGDDLRERLLTLILISFDCSY
jgi:hypothetical protein